MPQNVLKFLKFMIQTKVHWCSVFNSFFLFHPEANHGKHKKNLGTQLSWKCGLRFLKKVLIFPLNVCCTTFFGKAIQNYLSTKLFFQCKFKAKLRFWFKIWELIFRIVLSQDFLMFSVLSFRMEHKKSIENRTAVYFCLHHEFYKKKMHFRAFLLL